MIFSSNVYASDCYESQSTFGYVLGGMRSSYFSPSTDTYNEKCGNNMMLYSLANDKEGMYETLLQDINEVNSGIINLELTKRAFDDEKQYWLDLKHECGTNSELVDRIAEINEWAEEVGLTNGEFTAKYNKCKAQLLHYEKLLLKAIANGGNDDFVQGTYYGETKSGKYCIANIDQYEMVINKPGTEDKMETLILDASKKNAYQLQRFRTNIGKYTIRFTTDKNGRYVPYNLIFKRKKGSGFSSFRCGLTNL